MDVIDDAPPGATEQQRRIAPVDSLRGIGALVVMLYHVDAAVDVGDGVPRAASIAHQVVIALFGDGRAWVLLFFILSGFVLSISIERGFRYWRFAVRRITRLMIPCAAAILLSAALALMIHPQPLPGLTAWFNLDTWSIPVSWRLVLRNVMMTGRWEDTTLDGVLWTLAIELRISLIFPLLYFAMKWWPWLTALVVAVIGLISILLATRMGILPPYFNRNAREALVSAGYYMPLFVAGILARKSMSVICPRIARWNGRLALAAGLGAFAVALFLMHAGGDFRMTAGALLLLLAAVTVPEIGRAFSVKPLRWLGKISYSLYLVHMLVLVTVFHLFYGRVNLYLLSAVAVAASPLVAWAFYAGVVAPSIALGRRWTKDLGRAVTEQTAVTSG
jgi:peptidoglycan/LPS O-acetylase OafA/YrhL